MDLELSVSRSALFAELSSIATEARCVFEEYRHCQDGARRRVLFEQYDALQDHWNVVFLGHLAACPRNVTFKARGPGLAAVTPSASLASTAPR